MLMSLFNTAPFHHKRVHLHSSGINLICRQFSRWSQQNGDYDAWRWITFCLPSLRLLCTVGYGKHLQSTGASPPPLWPEGPVHFPSPPPQSTCRAQCAGQPATNFRYTWRHRAPQNTRFELSASPIRPPAPSRQLRSPAAPSHNQPSPLRPTGPPGPPCGAMAVRPQPPAGAWPPGHEAVRPSPGPGPSGPRPVSPSSPANSSGRVFDNIKSRQSLHNRYATGSRTSF